MALPEGFSEWEHLQSTLLWTQNRIVREEFNDVGGDDWEPDISTPRASLRQACTLKDDDSALMTLSRLWLYYIILRKAQDLQTPIYGIPLPDWQETVVYRPQVCLYFQQDWQSVPDTRSPVRAQISYRITDETSQTMTEAKALTLANRIKSEFGAGGGYRWSRGKIACYYRDLANGYDFKLFALSESEAREVIGKVLDLESKVPDWDKLSVVQPNATFPENPGNALVYGKMRPKPRRRPTAIVRFQYASLRVHGLPNDVILFDRSGYWKHPLVNQL